MAKKSSKPGPKSVGGTIKRKGSSPAHNVPGGPGGTFAQKPIPGPENPGMPISMKKALKRK